MVVNPTSFHFGTISWVCFCFLFFVFCFLSFPYFFWSLTFNRLTNFVKQQIDNLAAKPIQIPIYPGVLPKPIFTQPKKRGRLPLEQVERGHPEPPLTGKLSSCLGCEAKHCKGI
uniref:Uncharacterized protein n=1 Tax=Mus musculus TaxID=10090 RepID=Q3USF6_MOUSE|nr:unnamed protein product [Mus musculus]